MYHKHFGLREVPFSIKVNPQYLFMTSQHRDALAHLLYGTRAEGGFALLTGEVGTGKTTLIRALLQQLPDDIDIALVMNPAINAVELLATICDELGIEYSEQEERLKVLTDKLHAYLLEAYAQGRSAVVLIDEAQHLSFEALEQIRLLTNLETDTKKLLQIILVGQPELDDMLRQPELRQLAQRITARFYLGPLTQAETTTYIKHRLQVAGLPANQTLFPQHIVHQVYKQTEGIPRLINVLCDRILLGSYAKNSTQVDDEVTALAIEEVFGSAKTRARHAPRKTVAELSAASILANDGWSDRAASHSTFWFSAIALLTIATLLAVRWNTALQEPNAVADTLPESSVAASSNEMASNESIDDAGTDSRTADTDDAPSETVEAAASESATPTEDSAAVTNAVPTEDADVQVENDFWWDDGYSTETGALNALLLQLELLTEAESVPCVAISNAALSCYEEELDVWEELRQLNRVGVLKIVTPSRQLSYLPIVNMYSEDAVVLLRWGNTVRHKRVSLADLGVLWTGEAVVIWQVPEGYTRPIGLNASGKIVGWIADRFAEIDGREDRLASNRFNQQLLQRVKIFQASYGLEDDGMVGINTLLKISDASGLVTDLLLQTVDSQDAP